MTSLAWAFWVERVTGTEPTTVSLKTKANSAVTLPGLAVDVPQVTVFHSLRAARLRG